MKLILAIVNKADTKQLTSELMKGGFSVTKLSSTGGFIKGGTTTLIVGAHAERVQYAIEIMRKVCKSRKYDVGKVVKEYRSALDNDYVTNEVVVGGATVFVLNVEENIKI